MGHTHREPPVLMRWASAGFHAFPYIRSGLTRLSFNRVMNRQFARTSGSIVATLRNGIEMRVSPHDHDGRILYLFGTNDPKVHETVRSLVREGDLFLDIGANHASIGLAAADWVGPTGRVHLFEPQEALCAVVDAALRKAGVDNVVLHRVALLDRDDELRIARPREHSGMATLVTDAKDRTNWSYETVPVKDIARYVPGLVGSRPFAAKVDVEGAEPMILPWLLAQPNLRFLVFEGTLHRDQLWDMVRASGLTLFGLCRRVWRSRIRPVPSAAAMAAYHDLLAVRLPSGLGASGETSPKALGELLRSRATAFMV